MKPIAMAATCFTEWNFEAKSETSHIQLEANEYNSKRVENGYVFSTMDSLGHSWRLSILGDVHGF